MICDKKNCTGCFACYNICPKKAVEMKEDEHGYIYPYIDESKCVHCNICKKVCPSLNNIEMNEPLKCYAGRVKNTDWLSKSSSGGIATLVSSKIIKEHGVVYGAAFGEKCTVNHTRVDNIKDLDKLQGSKYVHSYINDTYKNVKTDLSNEKKVLFIGTPCQIMGLRRYLGKKVDNLFLIDIICHGVPSQKYLKDEVKRLNNNSLNIDRVNFRDKKYNNFHFTINKDNKTIFSEEWFKNPYFYTFMKSVTYRENCYSCKYAGSKRISDMTIGDFWGLKEDSKLYSTRNKGVSVILINTERGNDILKLIKDDIDYEERNINEAINGNDQLREPSKKSELVDKFKIKYKENKDDFYKTYIEVCKKHYYKQKIKSIGFVKFLLKLKKNLIMKSLVKKYREKKNG